MASMTELYNLATAQGANQTDPIAETLNKALLGFQGGREKAKLEDEKSLDKVLKQLDFMQKARAFQAIQQQESEERKSALDGIASTAKDNSTEGKVNEMIQFPDTPSGQRMKGLWTASGTNLPKISGYKKIKYGPTGGTLELGETADEEMKRKLLEAKINELNARAKRTNTGTRSEIYLKAADQARKIADDMIEYLDDEGNEITRSEWESIETEKRIKDRSRVLAGKDRDKRKKSKAQLDREEDQEARDWLDAHEKTTTDEDIKLYKKLKKAGKLPT